MQRLTLSALFLAVLLLLVACGATTPPPPVVVEPPPAQEEPESCIFRRNGVYVNECPPGSGIFGLHSLTP